MEKKIEIISCTSSTQKKNAFVYLTCSILLFSHFRRLGIYEYRLTINENGYSLLVLFMYMISKIIPYFMAC
jgi:hypothetical protein